MHLRADPNGLSNSYEINVCMSFSYDDMIASVWFMEVLMALRCSAHLRRDVITLIPAAVALQLH